jgi:hypothetical protein
MQFVVKKHVIPLDSNVYVVPVPTTSVEPFAGVPVTVIVAVPSGAAMQPAVVVQEAAKV